MNIDMKSHPIIQIATGIKHVLALNSDGKVFAWGSNELGQLGLGKSLTET